MLLAVLLGLLILAGAEISVIIVIAHLIGGLLTVVLLIGSTVGGLWLVRRERRRAWEALREELARGEMPDRELADAAAILGGGVLIALPGFITDVAGLLAVVPFTRPAVRAVMTRWVSRRAGAAGLQMTPPHPGHTEDSGASNRADGGQVIQGEVLDEHTDEPEQSGPGRTQRDGDPAG